MIQINCIPLEVDQFPDGTPHINFSSDIQRSVQEKNNARVTWKFDSMEELFVLQCVKDKLDSLCEKIELELPYIPNARMDRIKNGCDVFTLKSFSKLLNAMNFSKVIVNNAHSNVSLALIENVEDEVYEIIENFIKNAGVKFDTVMFPDEGAQKRYGDIGMIKNNFNVVTGMKKRDWKTGNILGLEILGNPDDIMDKNILIIDDICSRGGTFKFSSIELKKRGAKNIYVFVSHCENIVDIQSLKDAGVVNLFTTDSIYRGSDDFVKMI